MARHVSGENMTCITCSEDATDATMDCVNCKSSIHVIGCSEPDLCTRTILESWGPWQKKYPNIQFSCMDCLRGMESGINVSPNNKMADMEGKIIALNEEFAQLKKTLQKDIPPVHVAQPNVPEQEGLNAAPVTNNNNISNDAEQAAALDSYNFQPLSEADTGRANKLLRFLTNRDLRRVKTVFIIDSNGNGIKDKHLDSDGGCKVVTSGGLCIVGAVHALHKFKATHRNVKKVVYVIGTNDQLHPKQHDPSERVRYIKALHSETLRCFPNAHVNLVLPFGGTKIDYKNIEALAKDITEADVAIKQYRGPNMRNKLNGDNLHMNPEGKSVFKDFLRSRFIPKKPNMFSRINHSVTNNSSSDTNIKFTDRNQPSQTRVNHIEPNRSFRSDNRPDASRDMWSSVVATPSSEQPLLEKQVAEAVAKIMATHRDRSSPFYPTSYPPYGVWPR